MSGAPAFLHNASIAAAAAAEIVSLSGGGVLDLRRCVEEEVTPSTFASFPALRFCFKKVVCVCAQDPEAEAEAEALGNPSSGY